MMTEPKFVDVDGIRTRYFDKGSGEVLLLVHGSHMGTPDACESAIDWEFNFDVLAERFRVIAMDKLGQGYTGNPKSDADYTMAATVKHAAGLLQALGLKNVHVIGHSRGGYVVTRLTLDHPELVRSCVIVDSGTLAPGPSKTEFIMANAPKPRLSRESQRWCIEHYSFRPKHITQNWLDTCEDIAKSEMHIINEAGHFCYREQPETFNGIVKAFVERSAKL